MVYINPDIIAQEKFSGWNNQTIKQYQPLFNWAQIIYDSVEFNQ